MACIGLSMKEKVDLNSNGNSIESPGKIFKRDKWTTRYIVCKKPNDLRAPVFTVFKSQHARNHNNFKASFCLQNYIGYESGFELKKQANTLAILTKEEIIILAFSTPENLVIWESWLKNTCGQSQCFFVQLQRTPKYSLASSLIRKEVRLHLHDSRFALVHGRPQMLLEYANLADTLILAASQHAFTFATQDRKTKDDCYTVSSARLPIFYNLLDKARRNSNELHNYLASRNCDGDWLPEITSFTRAHSARSYTSDNINGISHYINTPVINRAYTSNLDRGKSKSGCYVGSNIIDRNGSPRLMQRASSVANYANYQNTGQSYQNLGMFSPVPVNTDTNNGHNGKRTSASRQSSFRSRPPNLELAQSSHYCNVEAPKTPRTSKVRAFLEDKVSNRCLSLPDYVNVECTVTSQTPTTSGTQHRSAQRLYTNVPSVPQSASNTYHHKPPIEPSRRRSENSVGATSATGFQDYTASANAGNCRKQRSMVDFSMSERFETPVERYENWRKAKKFISSFKPKSEHQLQHRTPMMKSSSVSALTTAGQRRDVHSSCSSLSSQFDDQMPPSLNIAINEPAPTTINANGEIQPPEGLVKVPEAFPQLTARSGVGAILARRLQTAVRGSFSKYDGERATHHYTPSAEDEENVPTPHEKEARVPIDPLQGIMSAVKSGQERLKESDRRASSVSFKHNLLLLPQRLAAAASKKNSQRGSTSFSEETSDFRSSVDSMSSDARSRISIKRRSDSPPKDPAPQLPLRQLSQHTLINAPNSSAESLTSDRTVNSESPTPLPVRIKTDTRSSCTSNTQRTRSSRSQSSTKSSQILGADHAVDYCTLAPPKAAAHSSNTSLGSRQDYIIIDPVTTKAVRETSEMTQKSSKISLDSDPMHSTLHDTMRRKSQGTNSFCDTVSLGTPGRQGFFKKYRKTRRSMKQNAVSTGELNVQ